MTSIDPATRLYGLIMAGTIPHEPAQDAERFEIWREKVSWHMAQQGRGGVKFIQLCCCYLPSCGDSGLQRWGWLEKMSELICTIFNFCRVKAPKFFACFKCSFNLHVIILPHHFFCLATAPCLLDLTRRVMQRNLPLATLGNMFSAINIRTITQALDNQGESIFSPKFPQSLYMEVESAAVAALPFLLKGKMCLPLFQRTNCWQHFWWSSEVGGHHWDLIRSWKGGY